MRGPVSIPGFTPGGMTGAESIRASPTRGGVMPNCRTTLVPALSSIMTTTARWGVWPQEFWPTRDLDQWNLVHRR
jgi:hypothetical protein